MDIKALIKKYEELWNEHSPFYEPVPYTSMVELFLKELKQLDEPHKVTIPKFVADYIEFKKKYNFNVYGAMRTMKITKIREFPIGSTKAISKNSVLHGF